MPAPTRIYDISATAASNFPQGTDTIGTSLDDVLRAIQAVFRGDLAHKGSDIASAATTDLGAVTGLMHDITGTTTITSFGTVSAGVWKLIKFEGALTLTHNATSLICPGGENITTADGDVALVMSEGSGNWRVLGYWPYVGPKRPVLSAEQATTSGTSKDFTGIPSWVKRITVMFVGVSTNGTSNIMVQLGDSGGIEATGYSGSTGNFTGTVTANHSTGFLITSDNAATRVIHGQMTLTLQDSSDNTWIASSMVGRSDGTAGQMGAGSKALSATLDRVRITTANGTDAFDAGSVSIMYE